MSTGNIKNLRKKKIKMHSFIIFMLIFKVKVREARTEEWAVKTKNQVASQSESKTDPVSISHIHPTSSRSSSKLHSL